MFSHGVSLPPFPYLFLFLYYPAALVTAAAGLISLYWASTLFSRPFPVRVPKPLIFLLLCLSAEWAVLFGHWVIRRPFFGLSYLVIGCFTANLILLPILWRWIRDVPGEGESLVVKRTLWKLWGSGLFLTVYLTPLALLVVWMLWKRM